MRGRRTSTPADGPAAEARWLAGLPETARERLPAMVHEYVAQGAREQTTAGEAAGTWGQHRFRPHVLRDVTHVDLSVDLLGRTLTVPWGVAPMTLQRAAHPDGEVAMARACAASGSLMVVSSNAGTTFADVAATGVPWWVQAYLPSDRTLALPLLGRAVEAGAGAVVLTVDTPVVGTKYGAPREDVEAQLPGLTGANHEPADLEGTTAGAEKALDLGPHDLAWLSDVTGLPVVVKGVLRADDAVRCVQAGAAAVWVSNHGGRQLDRATSSARALPEVARAVDGAVPVYVDGGIHCGLDVLTALGLGADAVFLGRTAFWALVDGEDGVRRMHTEMAAQTEEAMRLAGCSSVADTRGVVVTEPASDRPHPL